MNPFRIISIILAVIVLIIRITNKILIKKDKSQSSFNVINEEKNNEEIDLTSLDTNKLEKEIKHRINKCMNYYKKECFYKPIKLILYDYYKKNSYESNMYEEIKNVCLEINKYEECDNFIETYERELIINYLYDIANLYGQNFDKDITENWRNW